MNEVTFDNGKYLQIKSRSGRWESVNISSHGRGDVAGTGGTREMALAHYAVRSGLPAEKYTWLQRYRDYMIERYGCENWGVAPNWFYEWTGWGTLTKRLTPWMAGDPVTFLQVSEFPVCINCPVQFWLLIMIIIVYQKILKGIPIII